MKSSGFHLDAALLCTDVEAGCNPRVSTKQMRTRKESNDTTTSLNSFSDTSMKQIIRNLSSQMVEEKQLAIDEERLKNAVQDAGQYAFGIAAVEVWVLDDDTGRLVRPKSGWWRDPTMPSTDALSSLEEVTNSVEIMPGVCLAGVLFAESSTPAATPTNATSASTEPPKSSIDTTTRTHRKTLTQYWQWPSSSTAEPDPSLQNKTSTPGESLKKASHVPEKDFQVELPAASITIGNTNLTIESKGKEGSTLVPLANDDSIYSINTNTSHSDTEQLATPKTVTTSGSSKRLYWKSHPTSGDGNTIVDYEDSPPTNRSKDASESDSLKGPSLSYSIGNEVITDKEEAAHFENGTQPKDPLKHDSSIRLQNNINKKKQGDSHTLSSVTFHLEKIFEDNENDKINQELPSSKNIHLLANSIPEEGLKPKSAIYSHRKSKSFHPRAVGLESLKQPLVSNHSEQVPVPEASYGSNLSEKHHVDAGPQASLSHRRSKSLHWQKEPLTSDLPTFYLLDCFKAQAEDLTSNNVNYHPLLHFRDIKSLLHDPDTAKTPRLALLDEAGFSHAAGISFQSGGVEGIVIYYTIRISTNNTVAAIIDTNSANLAEGGTTSIANQVYLLRATELIGAVVASIEARRAVMVMKLESSLTSPSTASVTTSSDSSFCIEQFQTETKSSSSINGRVLFTLKAAKSLKVWRSKCCGGNLQIPPAMPWEQSSWTFVGVLTSVLLLSGFNRGLINLSGGNYFILGGPILGPIGSVIALQYGSASAPTAQPRNIILGQLVAGFAVLPFTFIPNWILSQWIKQAIGAACAVMAMVKVS